MNAGERWIGVWLPIAVTFAACATEDKAPAGPEVAGQAWPLWGGETDTGHDGVVMIGHSRQPPSCSGTLIAPNLAITAQHCVSELTNTQDMNICNHQFGAQFDRPYVLIGDSLYGPYEIILGAEVVVPQGCTSTCGCDIGLIILERNAPDPSIAIGVQTKRQPFEGEPFDLVAFGTTNQMGAGFGVRRRRSVSVECFSWGCGGGLSANEFASTSGGCEGDSGGPGIDDEGLLLGVISRTSFPCDDPKALNLYTSVQWTLDLVAETARRAAMQGGYPVPTWAEPAGASACETANFCGPHMEADGSPVDCGTCTTPAICGSDGTCAAPVAAPPPTAGMGGGPIGDMFQGVWCKGVVCPAGWVCAGDPATCAMACDPAAPACDGGTTCDPLAGACLTTPGADAGIASGKGGGGDGGGCSVAAGPADASSSWGAWLVLVVVGYATRLRGRSSRARCLRVA